MRMRVAVCLHMQTNGKEPYNNNIKRPVTLKSMPPTSTYLPTYLHQLQVDTNGIHAMLGRLTSGSQATGQAIQKVLRNESHTFRLSEDGFQTKN